MTLYTVPNGKKAYLTSFFGATLGAKKATNIDLKFWQRSFGGVFRLQEDRALDDNATSNFTHEYVVPNLYAAKTDLKFTAQLTASAITGGSVGAGFEIILIDD